jgi:sodium borate transporter 11
MIGDLKKIPTAVICDGLFLVMGISGLPGNELFERVKLLFIEQSLYPPMHFSFKQVPISRMHVFTLFQLSFVGILYGVARSPIALAFPVFLLASIPARMFLSKLTGNYLTQDMVDLLDHKSKSEEVAEDAAPGVSPKDIQVDVEEQVAGS